MSCIAQPRETRYLIKFPDPCRGSGGGGGGGGGGGLEAAVGYTPVSHLPPRCRATTTKGSGLRGKRRRVHTHAHRSRIRMRAQLIVASRSQVFSGEEKACRP